MLRSRLTGLATAAAVIAGMVIGAPVVHAEGPDTTPPTVTIISPVENQQVPIGVHPLPTVQYTATTMWPSQTCDASIGPVNRSNPWITVENTIPLDSKAHVSRSRGEQSSEMVREGPRDETGEAGGAQTGG